MVKKWTKNPRARRAASRVGSTTNKTPRRHAIFFTAKRVGCVYALLAAVCWATVPLFTRFLYAGGYSAATISMWRVLLSAGCLWVVWAIAHAARRFSGARAAGFGKRGVGAVGVSNRGTRATALSERDAGTMALAECGAWVSTTPRAGAFGTRSTSLAVEYPRFHLIHLPFFILYGLVGVAALIYCNMQAMAYLSVPMATALLYLAPAFVVVTSALLLQEPISKTRLLAVGLTLAGCGLAVQVYRPASWTFAPTGLLFGLLAGMAYAGHSMMGRAAVRKLPAVASMRWMFTMGVVWMLILVRTWNSAPAFTPAQWCWMLALALISTVLANIFFMKSVELLGSAVASLLLMTEPVISVALAVIYLRDSLAPLQALGMGAVLAGAMVAGMGKGKMPIRGNEKDQ